jgi:predicted metalloprotease with PDZ domain
MRSGISDSAAFLDRIAGNITGVGSTPPAALADASMQPWINPTDGSGGIYYPKGALAGFMLDLMIRDASNNTRSLDDVMRTLYETTYKKGLGFTPAEWWGTISQYAGGKSFDAVNRRFIEGRDPYPWDSVLAFAGLRITTDTVRDVAFGLVPSIDSEGVHALFVIPGGAAQRAGIKVGDIIVSLGDMALGKYKSVDDALDAVRSAFQDNAQAPYVVRRGSETVNGSFPVQFDTHARTRIAPDPNASERAQRIRRGLFHGSTS